MLEQAQELPRLQKQQHPQLRVLAYRIGCAAEEAGEEVEEATKVLEGGMLPRSSPPCGGSRSVGSDLRIDWLESDVVSKRDHRIRRCMLHGIVFARRRSLLSDHSRVVTL